VVGAGAGGVVVEVVVVACSASRMRRIFTSGDWARRARGDADPWWPWRPWAEATATGPAVAARTVAPGSDTIRPKRAIVRLAGRRAFSLALWRALWRAFSLALWRAFWRASCRRAERFASVWRGSPVMVV
jgi:hypothetical protein